MKTTGYPIPLYDQNLGGQLPTLPTWLLHPCILVVKANVHQIFMRRDCCNRIVLGPLGDVFFFSRVFGNQCFYNCGVVNFSICDGTITNTETNNTSYESPEAHLQSQIMEGRGCGFIMGVPHPLPIKSIPYARHYNPLLNTNHT